MTLETNYAQNLGVAKKKGEGILVYCHILQNN